MPSAARPFTPELVAALVPEGVLFAPVTLHTGVSSLERGEAPYPERYRVPAVDRAARQRRPLLGRPGHRRGHDRGAGARDRRRAPTESLAAARAATSLVVTPERGLRAVDGLLTGWHEPESSHLQMLEAVGGPDLLRALLRRRPRSAATAGTSSATRT